MQNKVSKINKRQKRLSGWHKYAVIALPYLWMALFFFVPFLIILKIPYFFDNLMKVMGTLQNLPSNTHSISSTSFMD